MPIEPGERLVEQYQMRTAREHSRERNAARLSTGDRVRGRIPNRFELQTFAQLRDPRVAAVARAVGQSKTHVLRHAQMRKQICILRQIADRAAV